jgi:hypothetical protein
MTTYRKNLFKALAVAIAIHAFWALSMYSQWYASDEGQRAAMDEIHREIEREFAESRTPEDNLQYLFYDDGSRPEIIFNHKTKKWENL